MVPTRSRTMGINHSLTLRVAFGQNGEIASLAELILSIGGSWKCRDTIGAYLGTLNFCLGDTYGVNVAFARVQI